MASVLALQNVSKSVRDGDTRRLVVEDVSFAISAGEIVCLRGPSGSGKTTLLALSGAMLSPTRGEVHVMGEATSRLREHHRAEVRRRAVGFVFQDLALVDDLSATENILLPAVPIGIDRDRQGRVNMLLERFGIASLAATVVRRLSGGERQRVALCRALLFDPPILLLDEPSAHLDDARADQLMIELRALVREGKAILFASHDSRLAADRTLSVQSGKVIEG